VYPETVTGRYNGNEATVVRLPIVVLSSPAKHSVQYARPPLSGSKIPFVAVHPPLTITEVRLLLGTVKPGDGGA